MSDLEIIRETVAGNNEAFAVFYAENHDYFFNCFRKYYPGHVTEKQSTTKTILSDLYHDAAIIVWDKIVCGEINEKTLTGPLVNYLIGVGRGLLSNSEKSIERRQRFLNLYQDTFSDGHHKSGQSNAESYVEVEDDSDKDKKNKPLRVIIGVKGAPMFGPYRHEEGLTNEQIMKRRVFIKEKLNKLGEPCYGLLWATLWRGLKDDEIVEEYPSLFKTVGQIRMRRKRCIGSLRNMISAMEKSDYLYID